MLKCCSVTKSCPILCNPMDCSMPKFLSTESMMLSISSSATPFYSSLQNFPSGSFPISQFFTSRGQSIGASASASVLPMHTQGSFPLGLTGFISLLSEDSQEYSPVPQFKSISPLALSLSCGPGLTLVHDHWKNHSSNYSDLCQKRDVSAS